MEDARQGVQYSNQASKCGWQGPRHAPKWCGPEVADIRAGNFLWWAYRWSPRRQVCLEVVVIFH